MTDLVRIVNSTSTSLIGFMSRKQSRNQFSRLRSVKTPSWVSYKGKREAGAPQTNPDTSIPTYAIAGKVSRNKRKRFLQDSIDQPGMTQKSIAELSCPHYAQTTRPKTKAEQNKVKRLQRGDGRSSSVRITRVNPTASQEAAKKKVNQVRKAAHGKQRTTASLVAAEARMRLMDNGCERSTINAVVNRIKDAFASNDPALIAVPLRRELKREPSLRLNILRLENSTVDELAEMMLDGDIQIVGDIACVMASAYLNDTLNEPEVDGLVSVGDDSNLPKWAKEQRSFVERWADEVLSDEKASGVALALARSITKRKMCILSFDGFLYREVSGADLFGESTGTIESFPFLMSIITLHGFSDVYGVAVFDKATLSSIDPSWKSPKDNGHYGIAYISTKAGLVSNPSSAARLVAERLITYLDCDTAIVETVYIDTKPSGRATQSSASEPTVEMSIIHGSDVVTGTRIVRLQKETSSERLVGGRKAHFRRGYYRRQRIGSRDDWHYEKRWVKPTFVHGSNPAIVERKVTRIVL